MMKRFLCGLVALSLSLWQVAPAFAGHNEPVAPVQLPADVGDVTRPAGSNTTTIQPGAVTAGKMATGAAAGNLGTAGGDLQGSFPNPTANGKLSRVANAAALATWTNYAFPVMRDDLQGYNYVSTGANCTIGIPVISTTASAASTTTTISVASGTNVAAGQLLTGSGVPAGDDVVSVSGTTVVVQTAVNVATGAALTFSSPGDAGWQVQPASNQCWRTDLSRGAPVTLWGAVDDDSTDNQPAFTKALAALSTVGGGRLIIPASSAGRCFRLASQVTFPGSNTVISGQTGPGASCVVIAFATGSGFLIGNGVPNTQFNDGVENLTFKHAVTRTSGADLEYSGILNAAGTNLIFQRGYYQAIDVGSGSFNVQLTGVSTTGQGHTGICLGCNLPGIAAQVIIDKANLNYAAGGAAIECVSGNGNMILHSNMDYNTHALWAHPASGGQCNVLNATDTFFDLSFLETVLVDGSAGQVAEWSFHGNVWIASSGKSPAGAGSIFNPVPTYSSSAAGLAVAGANAINNDFSVHAINNGGDGINLAGNANSNRFSGITTGNGGFGMSVSGGASHWSWAGRVGGPWENSTSGNAQYGVYVDPSAGDYYQISGDLSGNTKAGLLDSGNGTHKLTSQVLQ